MERDLRKPSPLTFHAWAQAKCQTSLSSAIIPFIFSSTESSEFHTNHFFILITIFLLILLISSFLSIIKLQERRKTRKGWTKGRKRDGIAGVNKKAKNYKLFALSILTPD